MSATTLEIQKISLFLRNTLSAFIKCANQEHTIEKLEWRALQGIVNGRNLGTLFSFCHKNTPLPPPVIQDWQQMKMATSLQNLTKLKITTDLANIAEKAGVRAVAMRGIVLAHSLYADPAMRPMHDIDLLIRPDDQEEFLAAMKAAGHVPMNFFRSQYVYKINNVIVEVHWQLLSNKRYREMLNSDVLVSSSTKVDTPSGYYYRLDEKWEIIGLVMHAFTHHNLSQLFSLIDIGLYMQNKEIDWQDIAHWSVQTGISKMMHLTFGFVNHLFDLDLEKKVLDHFSPGNQKAKKYYQIYLEQVLARITLSTHFGIKRSQFYVAETYCNKGREFLRLFSPKERRFLRELIAAKFSNKKQKLKA